MNISFPPTSPSYAQIRAYRVRATRIYQKLEALYPQAKIALDFDNHFQLLVAVMLSAQATDISVNKVTQNLFKRLKTPQDILNFTDRDLEDSIKTIGLWKAKSRNLKLMSQALIDNFDSKVPSTLEHLTSLAGVGRKTASVVLNIAFCVPVIAVDTHVMRLSQRLALAAQSTQVDKVADYLNAYTPKKFLDTAHHLLIAHGRALCLARAPKCSQCPLQSSCLSYNVDT